jgi:hypothetical protein
VLWLISQVQQAAVPELDPVLHQPDGCVSVPHAL